MILADCQQAVGSSPEALNKLRNRVVYVTGGTGFIGTWIAELVSYLNDVHDFGIQLLLLARDPNAFQDKTPHLSLRSDIRLIRSDVRNIIDIPVDVNYIIHAAATPDNRQHMSNPLVVMETITKGTGMMLDAATRLPHLSNILNISSGQIYGQQNREINPIIEDIPGTLPCNSITSIYPEAKRYAETICSAYWSTFKLPIVTARPFAFIGPYQSLDKPWAINNFIRDALNGHTIRIISNGMPVRSYMYPSDMAYWLLRMLVDGKSGTAYNLGSPYGITLRDIAEKVKRCAESASEIVIKEMHRDKSVFVPDNSRVSTLLNLDIQVSIDEAIARSIQWFRGIKKS